jgi:hypothetical protein
MGTQQGSHDAIASRRSTPEGSVVQVPHSGEQATDDQGISLEDLAARVYALLKRDLRVERERLGRSGQ